MSLPVVEFIRTDADHQGRAAAKLPPLPPLKSMDGLYLHVPFCFHRCHYCDFFSVVDRVGPDAPGNRQDAFIAALLREITTHAEAAEHGLRPDTLFVGGGTPTLLRPDLWQILLKQLSELGVLKRITEFTVEANPETVTHELAAVLAGGGVNRVSIGAQSFEPTHLKTLERWHDPASVARAVKHFREAGIRRINLDLIFGIPGQSVADFDADLDAALHLGVEHLSCYGLTYEPNTALTTRLRQGKVTRCDEEVEAAMYEHAMDRLAAAGFEHYEVSAWAKPGERCRHNLHYWRNGDWLGIGPGAASHVQGVRWKNKPHLEQYLAASPRPPIVDWEQLDARGRADEQLMMGLRLREGVTRAWLDEAFAPRAADIERLITSGFLEQDEQHTRLTRRGLLVADSVIGALIG